MPKTYKVPNDVANDVFLVGVQSAPGVPATVTHRFNGKPDINGLPPVTFDDDANGTYLTKTTPILGIPPNDGTLGEVSLSYERMPSHLRAICKSGGTPFTGSGPDYTYKQSLALSEDDADLMTWIYGTPGLLERATDVRYSELNIQMDIDNANAYWTATPSLMVGKWEQLTGFEGVATAGTTTSLTMTGAAWTPSAFVGAYVFPHADDNRAGARKISANTSTALTPDTPFDVAPTVGEKFIISFLPPAGIPLLTEEKIKAAGTKLFLDTGANLLGTTQILKRFISFNVTMGLNLDNKVFAENEFDRSGVFGRGSLDVTGQIRLEADRPDEIRQLLAMTDMKIRFEKLGSDLGGGVRKMARIDIQEANWTDRTRDTRNNNKTRTLAFRGTSPALPIEFTTRNGLSVLPS